MPIFATNCNITIDTYIEEQNVYESKKTNIENAQEVSVVEKRIPPELNTAKAQQLWKIAIEHGWVREDLYPILSMSKATILAATIADKLALVNKWKPFEELWETKNLKGFHNSTMQAGNSNELFGEINEAYKNI